MPITGLLDGKGSNDGLLARVNTLREEPGGALRFRCPDGELLPEGLVLHARTAMPLWQGERLNVGYAIDVLHPLALRE